MAPFLSITGYEEVEEAKEMQRELEQMQKSKFYSLLLPS